MAKNEVKYPYPSVFGSHESMLNPDASAKIYTVEEETSEGTVQRSSGRVVCTDEFGDYETSEDRLDNGLADPNRYNVKRLGRLF